MEIFPVFRVQLHLLRTVCGVVRNVHVWVKGGRGVNVCHALHVPREAVIVSSVPQEEQMASGRLVVLSVALRMEFARAVVIPSLVIAMN